MKRNKTIYLIAITLVIAGLLIPTGITVAEKNQTTAPQITVTKSNAVPQKISTSTIFAGTPQAVKVPLAGTPVFTGEGDQHHPGFARTLTGTHIAAYRDEPSEHIVYTFSTDDGATYDPGVYYQNENDGDFPSIKYWGGNSFFGTFVTNYNDLSGAPTYVFGVTDPLDYNTWTLLYWDWSTYGWYEQIDADIACDNSQASHEWGFSSYVMSTTYGDGYINGPTITYADPADPNSGYISWYYECDNCIHTDVDIDHVTKLGYCVYDQTFEGATRLLVRDISFEDPQGSHDYMYEVTGSANLSYPAVAANDDNILILAVTNENGNDDIVCLHGSSIETLQSTLVVQTSDAELYPDIQFVQDETFQAIFMKNGKLYKTETTDAGATWSAAEEIGDSDVAYKAADLTEYGVKTLYGASNGEDLDVFLADVGEGPLFPNLQITLKKGFGLGVTATISNTDGTALATNVKWELSITGGVLGLINKVVNGTISSLAIDAEEPVKTGLVFGLGTVDIKASATCDEGMVVGPISTTGTQLAIFTIVK